MPLKLSVVVVLMAVLTFALRIYWCSGEYFENIKTFNEKKVKKMKQLKKFSSN